MTRPAYLLKATIAVCVFLPLSGAIPDDACSRPLTDRATLEELSRSLSEELERRRPPLYYELLRSDRLPQLRLNENRDIQLILIDERGYPVFYAVDNLDAARTISTDDVWPGGSGGFSLSGSETSLGELGIWDGGGVLTTHQEFSGRVTQMDGASGTHYHATHVAGTLIGEGVEDSAKGMSFQGRLAAYDWNNDNSEMASAAASGMNVSNHSYGYATGWYWSGDWYWFGDITISTTEDYGFGFYGSEARTWDSIGYSAPYYTIVKSAGNDRNDYGPGAGGGHWVWNPDTVDWVWSTDTRDQDGGADGYDCVSWNGTAKNIITVGAVYDIPGGYTNPSDVVMSDFSGWGPTDDGRVKPDLVANGISLYSCTDAGNSSYARYSGTSMSSPNLSGSLNLLVRHYEATHGDATPLSSTMKTVVIQTADEAGSADGPDYEFGWGLMNTLRAAQLIEADSQALGHIVEDSLDDGNTVTYCLYSGGSQPVRLTLVWTDPPGTSPAPSLNPTTSMLVNDMDLRLEHVSTSTTYQPYVLDPANPGDPAATGDNVRDNVEQIHVGSPAAGVYRVTVTHKAALGAVQYYSLASSDELYAGPCNQAPVLTPIDSQTTYEGDTLSFTVTAVDPDGDSVVLSAEPLPTNASFVDSGNGAGGFFFTPDHSQSGVHGVSFIAWDGSLADSQFVTITVIDVNRAPALDSIGPQYVAEGETLNLAITASDPDFDSLVLSVDTLFSNASFIDHGDWNADFQFAPDFTQAGLHNITFVGSDSALADSESVVITVANTNRPPVLDSIGPRYVAEGETLSFSVTSRDPDGDSLILSVDTLPANASFVDNGDSSGDFQFTPDFTQAGPYNITFFVSDTILADSELVVITVANTNRPPVLDSIGPQYVAEGETLSLSVTASDLDSDSLVLSVDTLPPNASFTDNGDWSGDFRFWPDFTQAGPYNITFVVSDGTDADSESVIVTVTDENRAPVLDSIGPMSVVAGDTLSYTVTAADPDGDSVILLVDTLPQNASFIDNSDGTGDFFFAPEYAQIGTYMITFTASDTSLTDSEIVEVSVIDLCGDCNGDGRVTTADATYLVGFIYRDGPQPIGPADVNLDGRVTTADATYIISYIYRAGPPPCEPPQRY